MKSIQSNIKKAKKYLDNNHCVAVPTETVYGLAANAYSNSAVMKIFSLKKRPLNNPLIVHYYNINRLKRALHEIDIVIHAAAIKHVPVVEYNPFEAVKTNIIGSQNVIDASLAEDVEICVCVGTDKGVAPLNTYGASKLLMERLFVSASNYLNPIRHKTKFIAVRYGNVLGSNGSVVPKS